jgi:hypothetical protein
MADSSFDEMYLDEEDVFDPLADDFEPAQEGEDPDADGIVDLPVMTEMPEEMKVKSVFDKTRFDSARDAIEELLRRNPGRKPVFLQIIEFCCDERSSDEVAALVEGAQAENRSVYTPQSLCSILERAGALVGRSEVPADPQAEPAQPADEGAPIVSELAAAGTPVTAPAASEPAAASTSVSAPAPAVALEPAGDPGAQPEVDVREVAPEPTMYWTATDDGLTVLASHREGLALEELLASETESVYLPVYERVLAFCAQKPRPKPQIDAIVDDDPLVQKPRRYSNHFIELLENREALSWHDGGWNATELGRRYLERHGLLDD